RPAVHVDLGHEALGVLVEERADVADGRIADQEANVVPGSVGYLVGRVGCRQVDDERPRRRPGRLQFEGTRGERALVTVDEQEVETAAGEAASERGAHADRRAGYDGEGSVALSEGRRSDH